MKSDKNTFYVGQPAELIDDHNDPLNGKEVEFDHELKLLFHQMEQVMNLPAGTWLKAELRS